MLIGTEGDTTDLVQICGEKNELLRRCVNDKSLQAASTGGGYKTPAQNVSGATKSESESVDVTTRAAAEGN